MSSSASASDLFRGLIDDAAVFPPGDAPLPQAIERHHRHRAAWYAPLIGPLVLPGSAIAHAAALAASTAPLSVAATARPGTPIDVDAVLAAAGSHLTVVGIERGWEPDLASGPLVTALEIPRGPGQDAAIADLAQPGFIGKFRTGPTPTWEWPDETELAGIICRFVHAKAPFKLTGGLHHAVRRDADGEDHHGLVNVLLAVHAALDGGAAEEVAAVLTRRDGAGLADDLATLDATSIAAVRARFLSFGCCDVREPIAELVALELLTPSEEDR